MLGGVQKYFLRIFEKASCDLFKIMEIYHSRNIIDLRLSQQEDYPI